MPTNENDFLVKLDLQHFADDLGGQGQEQLDGGQNQDPQGQGVDIDNPAGKGEDAQPQQKQNEHMIPKTRFDEVNEKMKALQAQLDTFTQEKEQAELESKKKKGEFESLYNEAQKELEQYKENSGKTSTRVEQLEGVIQTLVDQELEGVPEDLRDLIPENFTPEQKLSWIASAKAKGLFAPNKDNGKKDEEIGGQTNPKIPEQDVSKMSVVDLFRSAYGAKK